MARCPLIPEGSAYDDAYAERYEIKLIHTIYKKIPFDDQRDNEYEY
jgi:hypothetical protein